MNAGRVIDIHFNSELLSQEQCYKLHLTLESSPKALGITMHTVDYPLHI